MQGERIHGLDVLKKFMEGFKGKYKSNIFTKSNQHFIYNNRLNVEEQYLNYFISNQDFIKIPSGKTLNLCIANYGVNYIVLMEAILKKLTVGSSE